MFLHSFIRNFLFLKYPVFFSHDHILRCSLLQVLFIFLIYLMLLLLSHVNCQSYFPSLRQQNN